MVPTIDGPYLTGGLSPNPGRGFAGTTRDSTRVGARTTISKPTTTSAMPIAVLKMSIATPEAVAVSPASASRPILAPIDR